MLQVLMLNTEQRMEDFPQCNQPATENMLVLFNRIILRQIDATILKKNLWKSCEKPLNFKSVKATVNLN